MFNKDPYSCGNIVDTFLKDMNKHKEEFLKDKDKLIAYINNIYDELEAQKEAIENSLSVLLEFSSDIIPRIGQVHQNYNAEYDRQIDIMQSKKPSITLDVTDPKVQNTLNIATNISLGVGDIFNDLERLSVYIRYDLIEQQLVYESVHKVFLDFYNQNKSVINQYISDDIPFKNLRFVYFKWSNWTINFGVHIIERMMWYANVKRR